MDTPKLDDLQTEATESLLAAIDRDTIDYLVSEAATTIQHAPDDELHDTLTDAVHELRLNGFGGADRTPENVEIYAEALWVFHPDVRDELAGEYFDWCRDSALGFMGYPVLSSANVDPDTVLLADPRAIAENPATVADVPLGDMTVGEFSLSIPMPVLVRNAEGLVAVDLSD